VDPGQEEPRGVSYDREFRSENAIFSERRDDEARHRGHTKKESMRILKRHLSDVVYRRMARDFEAKTRNSGYLRQAA
jgi:hypothetical protein